MSSTKMPLFSEEHAPLLRDWIVKRLENTSDADGEVLADYVQALLRSDGNTEDVKNLVENEISDFLKEDSAVFVNDVFRAIKYKAFVPGAPPPPAAEPRPPNPTMAPPPSTADLFRSLPQIPLASATPGGKKRRYHDLDAPAEQTGYGNFNSFGRPLKQLRASGHQPAKNRFGDMMALAGLPPFHASSQMGAMLQAQAMGYPLPAMPPYPAPNGFPETAPGPAGRGKRCRHFDRTGHCSRGSKCKFEHVAQPQPYFFPPPIPPPVLPPDLAAPHDEYDPKNATLLSPDLMYPQAGQMPGTFNALPRKPNSKTRGHNNEGGGKRRGRSAVSAEGAVTDKSKSTMVVENIPADKLSVGAVQDFFSEFGHIVNITMQPEKCLAIVKFDSWQAANAAYRSPKVIFDNRFVKLFWHKDEDENQPPGRSRKNGTANGAGNNNSATFGGGHDAAEAADEFADEPEFDMEEFLRKQEQAQKQHEEKMQKKQELERQRQDLEQRQQELLAKQREEKRKLYARIAASKGSSDGEEVSISLEMPAGSSANDAPSGQPTSQATALRAQLAALEEEAKMLGLDPNAVDEQSWAPRSGRGRGRGGYRARGSFRGSYRGGYQNRGDIHEAYASYSLDNRPRKVAIMGVDFTTSEEDEALRQHLMSIGEYADIVTTPKSTQVTFKDRKTAEKFFVGVQNGQIPGVKERVELAWVKNGTQPLVPAANATGAVGAQHPAVQNGAAADDGGEAKRRADNEDVDVLPDAHDNGRHAEVDYDVAGENDWDIA